MNIYIKKKQIFRSVLELDETVQLESSKFVLFGSSHEDSLSMSLIIFFNMHALHSLSMIWICYSFFEQKQ